MGKNSKVSLKKTKGKLDGRRGAGKTNFGKVQKGDHSMNPDSHKNKMDTSHPNRRSRATINRLKMYRSGGTAVRAKNGMIIKPMPFQSWTPSGTMARIEPNRKWYVFIVVFACHSSSYHRIGRPVMFCAQTLNQIFTLSS